MLAKRVIPCLDVDRGRVVKGINFVGLRDAGDPVEIARRYNEQGADELTFLDITASSEGRDLILRVVEEVAAQVFIPLTVGGGVRKVEDVRRLLNAGADKVSINTAAVQNPQLIADAAGRYGAQCIVVAIDAKQTRAAAGPGIRWEVFTHGGRWPSGLDAFEWARKMQKLGAVHAREQNLARAQLLHFTRPFDRVQSGRPASPMSKHLPAYPGARCSPRLFGVDRDHDALSAVATRGVGDELRVLDRGGVDGDLVGPRVEQAPHVLHLAHAAPDGEGNEHPRRDLLDDAQDQIALLLARGDFEERQLVCALLVVAPRDLDRIARVAQADEVDALHDPPAVDVKAGNNALREHGLGSRIEEKRANRKATESFPQSSTLRLQSLPFPSLSASAWAFLKSTVPW